MILSRSVLRSLSIAAFSTTIVFSNSLKAQGYHHQNSSVQLLKANYRPGQSAQSAHPAAQNVWHRIYRGYQLGDHANHPEVKRFIRQYVRNRDSLMRSLKRSTQYMHIIIEEVERRGIPTEIALLPLVESAFKPTALSRVGAAGLWQFMPATGHSFGLIRNRLYDGRLDSFAATGAALSYLQKLARQFNGDWMIGLAAYNAGPGRLSRAVKKLKRRRKPISYWRLSLPRETDEYVPRLLAFKEIVTNPQRYGITIPFIPNIPVLAQMRTNKPVDLRAVAKIAGLPTETLTQLNPYFKAGVTVPEYSSRIILPRRHAPHLVNIINRVPPAYHGRLAAR